jgi:hypothetical protein
LLPLSPLVIRYTLYSTVHAQRSESLCSALYIIVILQIHVLNHIPAPLHTHPRTNTLTHQHTNTPTHPTQPRTNTLTHQHTNTPTQTRTYPGLDMGVAQLSKNERAIMTIPAHLAYGGKGFPGLIPGNSELIFDIELIEIS